MELRYPLLLILLVTITVLFLVFYKKKKDIKFSNGFKIANTEFIKNTEYYKLKLKRYKLLKNLINISLIISILCSIILTCRVSVLSNDNTSEYNRDIFLCMDVSSSVDELNMQLVDNLKDTVKDLNGERFGISIFNSSSIVLVPLTDDYDYVLDVLDKIKSSIEANNAFDYDGDFDDDYFYMSNYIVSGTIEGAEERGSSLIGDGLASCVYSFSNLDEERTRIIIFSTDNDLAGKPIATLSQAADISKSKNIKVFGIGTSLMKEKDMIEFRDAVNKTGGKFYEQNKSTVKNIVSDIEKTSKSLLKGKNEPHQIDVPQIPFIVLILSFSLLLVLNRRMLK